MKTISCREAQAETPAVVPTTFRSRQVSTSVRHSSFVIRHWALLTIFAAQAILCCALAIALGLAIAEARRASVQADESYVLGYRDGGVRVIIALERARIERELIEENNRKSGSDLAAAGKGKL